VSNTAINGGNLPNFDAQHGLPKAVSDALDVLTSHLDALERLESDEAEVTKFRAESAYPHDRSRDRPRLARSRLHPRATGQPSPHPSGPTGRCCV
jgi:hypothetical protein